MTFDNRSRKVGEILNRLILNTIKPACCWPNRITSWNIELFTLFRFLTVLNGFNYCSSRMFFCIWQLHKSAIDCAPSMSAFATTFAWSHNSFPLFCKRLPIILLRECCRWPVITIRSYKCDERHLCNSASIANSESVLDAIRTDYLSNKAHGLTPLVTTH